VTRTVCEDKGGTDESPWVACGLVKLATRVPVCQLGTRSRVIAAITASLESVADHRSGAIVWCRAGGNSAALQGALR